MRHRHSTGRRRLLILTAVAALALPGVPLGADPHDPDEDGVGPRSSAPASVREEVVAEASPGSEVLGFRVAFMADGKQHLAWIERSKAGETVWLDGEQVGGVYDEIRRLNVLAGRLTFLGRQKSTWALIDGGVVLASQYTAITAPDVTAGGVLVAGACRERRCVLLVDGREAGPEFEYITAPDTGPRGDRSFYAGRRGNTWVAVIDGRETEYTFDQVLDHRWGAGGRRLAIAVSRDAKSFWIVDGEPGPAFDVIGAIVFSPDGRHFAYGAVTATRRLMGPGAVGTIVVDGTPLGSTYAGQVMHGNFAGRRTLRPRLHGISDADFTRTGELLFAHRVDGGKVVVRAGDQPGPAFDDIVSPILSPAHGMQLTYIAKQGDMFVEVRDHRAGLRFDARRTENIAPWIAVTGSGRLVYELVQGGRQFQEGSTRRALRRVVFDGTAGPEYNALGIACVGSADDARYACVVEGAHGDRDQILVDGVAGDLYDAISLRSIRFPEGAAVQFMARQGRRFLLVTNDARGGPAGRTPVGAPAPAGAEGDD